jgi:glycosyltransferase involved in cell wall biosynthesis
MARVFFRRAPALRRAVLAEIKPPRHKLHVIGNAPGHSKWESARSPAEVRTGLGISLNAKIILFIGRLADVKGCDLLIHALPGILADLPETVCVVAGSGPAEESLQNLASSLGIQEQIKFLGSRKDIAELLAAADVFCLPSREEGMSLALLEAMSAGKPIVASGIAANRAVITQNTTGMLVPPEDAGALRQALLDLLAHPDKAARLGTAAQAYALSTYNAQAQRETYDRLYRKLLSARICE